MRRLRPRCKAVRYPASGRHRPRARSDGFRSSDGVHGSWAVARAAREDRRTGRCPQEDRIPNRTALAYLSRRQGAAPRTAGALAGPARCRSSWRIRRGGRQQRAYRLPLRPAPRRALGYRRRAGGARGVAPGGRPRCAAPPVGAHVFCGELSRRQRDLHSRCPCT